MDTFFDEIAYDWLKPGTYVEVRPSYDNLGLLPFPTKVIIFAQKLATGSAEVGRLYQITRSEQGVILCGEGSIGAGQVAAFKRANATNEVWLTALADAASAVKATGKITVSGAPAVAGQLNLWIAGKRVRVRVRTTDTVNALATAIAAAINADKALYVTATAATGEVTLTARNGGDAGNDIDLRLNRLQDEFTPSGLSVEITAMAGGSGNPEVTDALSTIAGNWFTDIVVPWTDTANLSEIVEDAATRYRAMGKRDTHVYAALDGTFAQLTTKGDATNSPHLSVLGVKGSPTAPWERAASLAGIAAFHLTNDPARQLRTLELPGVLPPAAEDRFTEEEQELLLRHGISSESYLSDGTVTLDRVVTTYKLSNLNIADRAWLDIMVPKTMTRIRYDWASYAGLLYPRHKLASDNSPAAESDNVVTPRQMHGSWAARCKAYAREGWIDDATRTIAASVFKISETDRNRMEGRQRVRVIGNLMVLATALEFEA